VLQPTGARSIQLTVGA